MEENFIEKLEIDDEINNEVIESISEKNLNIYKKDINHS